MSTKPPLAIIAGPTASGKSALALALARLTPSTIINMDASQVYADLRILSARPSVVEEAEVPHMLFGHIDGAESCSAARWAADARVAIAAVYKEGRLPILVGGTGLYLRTLLDGIAPVPQIDADVRATVRALPVAEVYAALAVEDAAAAARLSSADVTRLARALEVVRSSGRPLKDWQAERVGGFAAGVHLAPLILLPPRDWLIERCDARLAAMLAAGAVEEVATLLARGLDPALPVMRAIGVRELSGGGGLEAAQRATRQYAKRQYTWFRNQCPADWLRHYEILNHKNINQLAIKLRNIALT